MEKNLFFYRSILKIRVRNLQNGLLEKTISQNYRGLSLSRRERILLEQYMKFSRQKF